MHPIIFSIGPITIYSFGVMLAIAFLASGNVVERELRREGLDPELASSFVLWAAIGGLVGSRLLSFVDDWKGFLADPLAFVFTGAGFVFYGGLIGGFATVSMFIWRRGLPWGVMVDCCAPALAVGQAIGRIGCLLAGDGDWGTPTTLPWAMRFPNAIIGWDAWVQSSGLPADVLVHPAPIYETLGYTTVFLILWSLRRRVHQPGTMFWLYLILSPTVRFCVEFIRLNPKLAYGLSEAQLISIFLVTLGSIQLVRSRGFGVRAAALILVALVGAGCDPGSALVGKPAPDFALSDLDGRTVRLANLKGRVVFVNVWATWCEPCRQEMPSMQALYERFGGDDFEMLAVSADTGDGADVRAFAESLALTFRVLRDPERQVSSRYRVTGYPETFLIDRNGKVVSHTIGPHHWSTPTTFTAVRRLIESGEWTGL